MRPRVRTATLTGYPQLCRILSFDPAGVLASVGLSPTDLDASDRWIPAAPVARLLESSAERSGVPDFAVRLAQFRRLGTLGPLAAVLRDEPDLRGVLDLMVEHGAAYNEALRMRMSADGSVVTLDVWLQLGEPAPIAQALDLVMAALVGAVRTFVRDDWRPLTATFGRPAPADPSPWQHCFGSRVSFGGDHTGLTFPAKDLDLPVAISDSSLRPYTHELLGRVVAAESDGVAAETAAVVELLLPLGDASADRVSRRMGLSPRQLQRALADDGETFSGIVNDVRAGLAERYLGAGGRTLTELSQQLGFAAPSALSRWFRQQFGTSPSAWRAAAGDGQGPPAQPGAPSPRARRAPEAGDVPGPLP
jgi:AraC-like DNA-binding protein